MNVQLSRQTYFAALSYQALRPGRRDRQHIDRGHDRPLSDWSDEETDDPIHADGRNFYKVEKWSRDGQRIAEMVFAGSSLDKARRIFERMTKHRPRIRLTIRQRTRVLQHHPPQ